MSVRILALLAVVAAFAPSTASAGLFGHGCCDAAPSCGCEVAAPSCGCEVAPVCDPCARPRLFGKLFSKLHSAGSCCDVAPSCGCEVAAPSCCAPAPAPSCCAPAPSCGCEAACDPCAAPRHHKLLGGLKSRLGGFRGCFSAPSCGCDVAPSCGCDAAPSCGCGM